MKVPCYKYPKTTQDKYWSLNSSSALKSQGRKPAGNQSSSSYDLLSTPAGIGFSVCALILNWKEKNAEVNIYLTFSFPLF